MKVHERITPEMLADQALLRMLASNYRAPVMALPREVLGELARRLLDASQHRHEVWKWLFSEGHHFSRSSLYRFADRFQSEALAVQRELLPHLIRRPLLTPAEVADELSVHAATVDTLIESGELPTIRIADDAVRVAPADLDAYRAEQWTGRSKRGTAAPGRQKR